jgi:hypothetical protein
MEKSTAVLIGMAVLGVTALAAFALYRWRQQKHVRQVEKWVRDYLLVRYGGLPNHLDINCSDDPLWPVLVAFDNPRTGIQHRLRFACPGPESTFSLLSEEEKR